MVQTGGASTFNAVLFLVYVILAMIRMPKCLLGVNIGLMWIGLQWIECQHVVKRNLEDRGSSFQ